MQTLLEDKAVATTQRDAFRAVMASLSPGGRSPSVAAAEEVLRVLERQPAPVAS